MNAIDTERLCLRVHLAHDLPDCTAMWSQPEVTRHIGGRPLTGEEVWGRVLRYIGHWSALGFGYWVIREKATDRFVGEVGFADFKRDVQPPLGAPEIGWALSPWAHGRGFATEAVRAVVAWGDQHFEQKRTVCLINPSNQASVRVGEKCGYKEYKRTTYKGEPTILFERT